MNTFFFSENDAQGIELFPAHLSTTMVDEKGEAITTLYVKRGCRPDLTAWGEKYGFSEEEAVQQYYDLVAWPTDETHKRIALICELKYPPQNYIAEMILELHNL